MSDHIAPIKRVSNLDEFYELGDFIAKGGFSQVFKGIKQDTGKVYAIKVMKKKELTGKRGMMVTRENEILRRCRHPNILALLEVVETDNEICMIMEYVKGGDLYDFLVERRSLSEADAARIIKGILKAVEYLHSAIPPIVHRDIKPENILIPHQDALDTVKLSDFGLSKILVDPKLVVCTPGGTSFYLPPEIIEGIKKHGASPRPTNIADMKALDVWSTGIVLYILLCGRPPFRGSINGAEEREKLLTQIKGGVQFAPEKWSGISDAGIDLVKKMLELDPKNRLSVKDTLNHPWIKSHDTFGHHMLNTPSVMASEYKDKKDFHDTVAGAAAGGQTLAGPKLERNASPDAKPAASKISLKGKNPKEIAAAKKAAAAAAAAKQ